LVSSVKKNHQLSMFQVPVPEDEKPGIQEKIEFKPTEVSAPATESNSVQDQDSDKANLGTSAFVT
jgi:hypothetical protein